MSTDAGHIGRETESAALGRTYRFGRWDRAVWAGLSELARRHLPDPVEALARHIDKVALADARVMREMMRLDKEEEAAHGPAAVRLAGRYVQQADLMTRLALDKACSYLAFGSPEMQSFITSPVGGSGLVQLLLRKHHPAVTEDEAFDVWEALAERVLYQDKTGANVTELDRVLAVVQGRTPPAKNDPTPGASPDPGEAPTGGASTPS